MSLYNQELYISFISLSHTALFILTFRGRYVSDKILAQ